MKYQKVKWHSWNPGGRLWVLQKMKCRTLLRALQCLHTHFVPAINLHVAFGKQNFSSLNAPLNILRLLHFFFALSHPHSDFLIYRYQRSAKHLAECNSFYWSPCGMWEITCWRATFTETANSGVMLSEKGCPATSFCSLTQLPVKWGAWSLPALSPLASSRPFVRDKHLGCRAHRNSTASSYSLLWLRPESGL